MVAVSRANVAHIAATVAETGARRRGDNALSTRQDDDNAVHAEMAHERTVFNLAVAYEGRSLDAIRASMRSRSDVLSARMTDAQRKLDTIHHASANVDMMNAAQVELLKSRIAATMAEKILEAGR